MPEQTSEVERKHSIRIHIDQRQYESPNPTTGEALYILGKVPSGLELYREVRGDREDRPIPKGSETVHLKEDEHFHSGSPKEHTIIVNGREKMVKATELSFADIVALAFTPVPTGPFILFTMTYRHGPRENPEGTMMAGMIVKIQDRMIFNVTATDKS